MSKFLQLGSVKECSGSTRSVLVLQALGVQFVFLDTGSAFLHFTSSDMVFGLSDSSVALTSVAAYVIKSVQSEVWKRFAGAFMSVVVISFLLKMSTALSMCSAE